jgi:hypothetical protein
MHEHEVINNTHSHDSLWLGLGEESSLYSFMIYYVIGDKDCIEMTKFLKISKMKNS